MSALSDAAILIDPAPGLRCRACEGDVDATTLRCVRCGAAYGEQNRCPHCSIVAGTEPDTGLGRCRACGGLRVSLDVRVTRSGAEAPLLARAERERRVAAWSRFGALAAGSTAALLLALAAFTLILHFSVGALLLSSLISVPILTALWLRRAASRAREQQRQALNSALGLVTADILRHAPATDAHDLARYLGVSAERALEILAQAEVDAMLTAPPTTLKLEAVASAAQELPTVVTEPEPPAARGQRQL